MNVKQPASALSSPRFCNMGTFMRMPRLDSAEGLDFAIAGAPFDTASSFRSGSRFGPAAIRSISAMMDYIHFEINYKPRKRQTCSSYFEAQR